jgi:hypothetical protein
MGEFDDLIPRRSDPMGASGADMFDDLIPKGREQQLRAEYLKKQLTAGEPGYSQRLKDSATLGLMRPISGLMHGISGILDPTSTFGERYRAGVGAEEDYAKRAVENTNPILGAVTDVAGGVGSMGSGHVAAGVARAARGLPPALGSTAADVAAQGAAAGRGTLAKTIAQGAGAGAVEGAARDAKDPVSALEGGIVGGTLGGAASAAVGAAAKAIPAVRGAEREARTVNQGIAPEDLRKTAKPIFQSLDMGGLAYAQPQTATLAKGIDDLIANNTYNKVAHSKISGYVDELAQKAQQPQGMGFNDLSNLRSALAKEARGQDPSTRDAARAVIEKIDDLVLKNSPQSNPGKLDVAKEYSKARELWKAAAIADDVGYTASKAERKVAAKSGVNPDEANRGAFRPLLEKVEKPGAYSQFGPKGSEQRKLLAKIVEGDPLQNAYRGAGAVVSSPVTKAVAGMLGASLGFNPVAGGLGGVAAGTAGAGAGKSFFNQLAANRGAQNIDALLRNITTGSSAPTANLPSREALAVLMAKRAAQRGAGAIGGSILGD